MVFGNDSDSSSIYSQPTESPLALAKNLGSPNYIYQLPINIKKDDDDQSSDEFNLKRNAADDETDTDDSFDNNGKPGSAILSYESNPDLDTFHDLKYDHKYYDTPISPPGTSMRYNFHKE